MTTFAQPATKPVVLRRIVVGAVLLAIGLIGVALFRGPDAIPPVIIPIHERSQRTFTVVDTGGRIVTSEQLRGKWLLVFFGELNGMDFCSKAFFPISAALAQQDEPFQIVLPLFISANPARDTPDALASFSRTLLYRFMLTHATFDTVATLPEQFSTTTLSGSPVNDTFGPLKVMHLIDPSGREAATLPCTASGLEIHELLTTATAETSALKSNP